MWQVAAPTLSQALSDWSLENGDALVSLGLAWARVAPTVALVPAFGLKAAPQPARAAVALLLAATIAPAVAPLQSELPWAVALVGELARGLPLAVAAALPLWVATMAGGLVDAFRSASDTTQLATLEGRTSPLGALFGTLAAIAFLGSGGPARVAMAAASLPSLPSAADAASTLARTAMLLAQGTTIAFAIAAPMLGAAIVVEVILALASRVAQPAQLSGLFAPVRSVLLLAALALGFERIGSALLALGSRAPMLGLCLRGRSPCTPCNRFYASRAKASPRRRSPRSRRCSMTARAPWSRPSIAPSLQARSPIASALPSQVATRPRSGSSLVRGACVWARCW